MLSVPEIAVTVIVLSVLPLVSVAFMPLLEVIEAAGAEPSPFTVTTCPTAIVPDQHHQLQQLY